MKQSDNLLTIIKELEEEAKHVDDEQIQGLIQAICEANRIFVVGVGRSGFVGRAFSNRLMHLGFTVYFIGEPTTPSIQEGDLLIIGSGSGETSGMVNIAKKAASLGVKIATLTIYPENSIGRMADYIIKIPGVSAGMNGNQNVGTIQPNGSSFEQLSWLVYDTMIVDLIKIKNQTQEQLNARHANLE